MIREQTLRSRQKLAPARGAGDSLCYSYRGLGGFCYRAVAYGFLRHGNLRPICHPFCVGHLCCQDSVGLTSGVLNTPSYTCGTKTQPALCLDREWIERWTTIEGRVRITVRWRSLGKDCSAPLTLSSRMLRGPSFGPARSTASHKLSRTIAIHSMLRRKTLARGEKHQPAEADIRPLDGNSRFDPARGIGGRHSRNGKLWNIGWRGAWPTPP